MAEESDSAAGVCVVGLNLPGAALQKKGGKSVSRHGQRSWGRV